MAPAAFGGLEVGEGPCEGREGSGQPRKFVFWERSEIAKRLLPRTWPQLAEERGDGITLQVADGLGNQLRGNLFLCMAGRGGKSVE